MDGETRWNGFDWEVDLHCRFNEQRSNRGGSNSRWARVCMHLRENHLHNKWGRAECLFFFFFNKAGYLSPLEYPCLLSEGTFDNTWYKRNIGRQRIPQGTSHRQINRFFKDRKAWFFGCKVPDILSDEEFLVQWRVWRRIDHQMRPWLNERIVGVL